MQDPGPCLNFGVGPLWLGALTLHITLFIALAAHAVFFSLSEAPANAGTISFIPLILVSPLEWTPILAFPPPRFCRGFYRRGTVVATRVLSRPPLEAKKARLPGRPAMFVPSRRAVYRSHIALSISERCWFSDPKRSPLRVIRRDAGRQEAYVNHTIGNVMVRS